MPLLDRLDERTRAWRRRFTIALLVALLAWPGVHYVLWRAWSIDPWHLAGWAMYGVPRIYDDIHVAQRDGSALPMRLDQMHALDRITRRASVLRYGYDPRPALDALVASWEPGAVDGVHLRLRIRQFDGRTGRFLPPETVWDVESVPASPRVGPVSAYASVVRTAESGGPRGMWRYPRSGGQTWRFAGEEGASPHVVSTPDSSWFDVIDTRHHASLAGSDFEGEPTSYLTACGDYPICIGADRPRAIYVEGTNLWVAACATGPLQQALRTEVDDDHRQEGRIVVWRSATTFCWVPADAPPATEREE